MADTTSLQLTIAHQQRKLDEAQWQLLLAQQFGRLMIKAYSAYRSYGVDYTKLRSYPLWPAMTPTEGFNSEQGRNKVIRWMQMIDKDIAAAIRRSGLHKVIDNSKDEPYA